MANKVGVPSMGGVKSSFGDFAYGLIGGATYGIATRVMGSGLLGLVAAPVVAGSVVKGTRGTIISTVAGFLAAATLIGGMGGGQAALAETM